MKKILYIVIFTILLIALAINIFSLSETSLFGIRIYKIGSGSMEPYLKVNDVILIKESDDYKTQDIVTYRNENEYITHRIVSINSKEIITKGDANNTYDDPITKDKIVGKLIYKFHIFSFISFMLNKPIAWILLFIIGLIIIFLGPNKKTETE